MVHSIDFVNVNVLWSCFLSVMDGTNTPITIPQICSLFVHGDMHGGWGNKLIVES